MKQFNFKLEGVEMLTKKQMKMVKGGCSATATCADGFKVAGYLDCNDMTDGGDGDVACGSHGDSTSCDCQS